MQIVSDAAQMIESYLNLSTAQIKNTVGNMANIDTPAYKTRGFDFDTEMQNAIASEQRRGFAAGPLVQGSSSLDGEVDGLISRPDGNNVSLDREGLKMAEAQLKFRVGVALLKQEMTSISNAIHSDPK